MWKNVVAPIVLVSLFWVIGSGITTYVTNLVSTSHSRMMHENVATIRAAGAMEVALWQLQAVVVESPGKGARESQVEAAEREADFERHLREAEQSCTTTEERALVLAIRERFAIYRDHIRPHLQPAGLTGLLLPQSAGKEKTIRLARAVSDPCQELLQLNERMLEAAAKQSDRLSGLVSALRFTFVLAGPLIGLLWGLWIARGLHRSISQISVTLKGAAGGPDEQWDSVEVRTPRNLPELQRLAQDVTDRIRHMVEELQEARQQAMSAERLAAVGELAAGIAHELRNPLTSVKLLVQTASQQRAGQSPDDQGLRVAQREIARMESTIQGLLDFARPPKLHRVRHDLRNTVRRALNLTDGRAKQQQITISTQTPDTPVMVDGDPEQLHQVLVNLLLNGLEAMPDGGVLELAVRVSDGRRRACRITVCDRGAGIPPQILRRIFEPFVTSKESGTGLGLAISRRIAEEHGGTLLAVNRTGGGAMFTLELPLSAAENDDSQPPTGRGLGA